MSITILSRNCLRARRQKSNSPATISVCWINTPCCINYSETFCRVCRRQITSRKSSRRGSANKSRQKWEITDVFPKLICCNFSLADPRQKFCLLFFLCHWKVSPSSVFCVATIKQILFLLLGRRRRIESKLMIDCKAIVTCVWGSVRKFCRKTFCDNKNSFLAKVTSTRISLISFSRKVSN